MALTGSEPISAENLKAVLENQNAGRCDVGRLTFGNPYRVVLTVPDGMHLSDYDAVRFVIYDNQNSTVKMCPVIPLGNNLGKSVYVLFRMYNASGGVSGGHVNQTLEYTDTSVTVQYADLYSANKANVTAFCEFIKIP